MKIKVSFTGYRMLFCISVFISINLSSFSQDVLAQASAREDEAILKVPMTPLQFTLADTILPTISNSGNGLLHYKCLSENNKKICIRQDENNTTAVRLDYDESEIRIVKKQQHFMEQQSIYEIQQQIRKDKMDIGLGEIIQGFYMKPPF